MSDPTSSHDCQPSTYAPAVVPIGTLWSCVCGTRFRLFAVYEQINSGYGSMLMATSTEWARVMTR